MSEYAKTCYSSRNQKTFPLRWHQDAAIVHCISSVKNFLKSDFGRANVELQLTATFMWHYSVSHFNVGIRKTRCHLQETPRIEWYKDLRFPRRWLRRIPSSRMWRRVALVRTEDSVKRIESIIMVTRIGELETTLAVTSNRRTLQTAYFTC
jgi:hypothetical protein